MLTLGGLEPCVSQQRFLDVEIKTRNANDLLQDYEKKKEEEEANLFILLVTYPTIQLKKKGGM